MKTLYNPTKETIEVQIQGIKYVVEAGKTVTLPAEHAIYWVKNLHHFMEIVADAKSADVVEPAAVVVEPKDEEVEVAEEVVVEKKVKKTSKK